MFLRQQGWDAECLGAPGIFRCGRAHGRGMMHFFPGILSEAGIKKRDLRAAARKKSRRLLSVPSKYDRGPRALTDDLSVCISPLAIHSGRNLPAPPCPAEPAKPGGRNRGARGELFPPAGAGAEPLMLLSVPSSINASFCATTKGCRVLRGIWPRCGGRFSRRGPR